MNFFGLTKCGFDKPIKDYTRSDYHEPREQPKNYFESKNKNLTLLERMREVDPYIGGIDGFPYGSTKIWSAIKEKKMVKPFGPMDMFLRPATESQTYGFWYSDPEAMKAEWVHPRKKFPYPYSDMSKYLTAMQKMNSIWNL